MSPVLLTRREGEVLVLTVNRPERRNAMSAELARALADALAGYEQDDSLRVAVLTGAGGTFCSGMDLKAFTEGQSPMIPGRGFGGLTERPPAKPLVAAVEGHAVAGGCEMVLACDLVVAARDARFGLPEVKRGLIASAGGLLRLPRRLPYHLAMEMVLTGEPIGAEAAHRHGLVNRLVAPGEALDEALRLARAVAANAPMAVRFSQQIVREGGGWPLEEMFERQAPFAARVAASADALEGARAFVEKRAARWSGE